MADDQKHPSKPEAEPPSGGSGRPDGGGRKGPKPPPPLKLSRGLMSWVMILALLIMLFVVLNGTKGGVEIETWQEFTQRIKNDAIENNLVEIKDDRVIALLKPGAEPTAPLNKGGPIWVRIDAQNRDFYLRELKELGVSFKANTGTSIWLQLLMSFAPILLIILIIWFFIARSMRGAGAGPGGMLGSFGKSRHRISSKDNVDVAFNVVAGVDEAKVEVTEVVEFL